MTISRRYIFYHHTVGYIKSKTTVTFITNNVKMRRSVIRETLKIIPNHLHDNYNEIQESFGFWILSLQRYQRRLLQKQCVRVIVRKFVKYLQEVYERVQIDINEDIRQIINDEICVAG